MGTSGSVPSGRAGPNPTFVFADLAGYTALTETHGDEAAADLAADFSGEINTLIGDYEAELIKTIGDAVMIRVASADDAIRLGLRIVDDIGHRHAFPAVRVGMHTGWAVERGGDWFGTTVNVAARISALARSGEVLFSAATWEALRTPHEFAVCDLGPTQLRNLSQEVRLYAASSSQPTAPLPIDPVCRMAVDPERAAGVLSFRGVQYPFCSLACAARFAAQPQHFVAP